MMLTFVKHPWKLSLLCLAILLAGGTTFLVLMPHQHLSAPATPHPQAQATLTPLPACVQLPTHLDWRHLSLQDLARYGLPKPPTSPADLTPWLLLIQQLKHRSCTISIHSLSRIHQAIQRTTAQQAQGCPPGRNCQNPTWAGGIADQFLYQEVEAAWTLPCLNKDVTNASSSAWVGLGGVESATTLVQAGVDHDVSADGHISYTAWAEAYTPASATTVFHDSQTDLLFSQGLHCSDQMFIQVSSDVHGAVDQGHPNTFFVGDITTGEYQYYNPDWQASDGSTAEWIVEQPTFVNGQSFSLKPLANFGTLIFTYCLGYVDDQGFLSTDVLPLQLVSIKGTQLPLATPAKTSLASLRVQWMRST